MTEIKTTEKAQIDPSSKDRLLYPYVDIYSRGEALRTSTMLGFLSGAGGIFVTAPFLSFIDENILARVAFMGFNYFSFSTAAFISGYRSEMRRINKHKDFLKEKLPLA